VGLKGKGEKGGKDEGGKPLYTGRSEASTGASHDDAIPKQASGRAKPEREDYHYSSYDDAIVNGERSGSAEVVVWKFVERTLNPRPSIVAGRPEQTTRVGHHEKALVALNNAIYSDLYINPGVERAAQL
jgi:hypothetical protein